MVYRKNDIAVVRQFIKQLYDQWSISIIVIGVNEVSRQYQTFHTKTLKVIFRGSLEYSFLKLLIGQVRTCPELNKILLLI